MLNEPSNEQIDIVNEIKNHNIIVDAVAGSGKTTTILHIAKKYPESNILVITYNKRLKDETRIKVKQLKLSNIDVHSYHSFCVKHYNERCFTDTGMRAMLSKNTPLKNKLDFQILIIDEAQDMTPLYYNVICKLNQDTTFESICVLGDPYQSIYDFNDADARFIKEADKLFNFNKKKWIKKNLSTSFRVTKPIAEFLNKCVLKEDRIISNKKGTAVEYVILNTFHCDKIVDKVQYYLSKGYSFDDFFILAPSVKNEKSPIRRLANEFTKNKLPIYLPMSDEEKLDKDILNKKIVFSTFHQVKGLERKIVIVYNFDDSYFTYFNKDDPKCVCPNTIYVAITRSLDKLILLHSNDNEYFKFLDIPETKKICNFLQYEQLYYTENPNSSSVSKVTELTRHLTEETINECLKYLNIQTIVEPNNFISLPLKVKQNTEFGDNLWESVSEINGIAIPLLHEIQNDRMILDSKHLRLLNKNKDILHELEKMIKIGKFELPDILKIANYWNCYKEGLNYKTKQIVDYKWLEENKVNECLERLKERISDNAQYEVHYIENDKPELNGRTLVGFIDCIDNNVVWEFKCVNNLDSEHILQLAIYMYLHKVNQVNNDTRDTISNKLMTILQQLNELEYNLQVNKKYYDYTIVKISPNDIITYKTSTRKSLKTNRHLFVEEVKKKLTELKIKYENILLNSGEYKYQLWNILDNHTIEIDASTQKLQEMISYLIKKKYYSNQKDTNEIFMKKMKEIRSQYK